MFKHHLILLVRLAQCEPDPAIRKMLWDLIEEAGLPPDATIVEETEESKENLDGRLLDQKEGGGSSSG